MRKYGIQFHLRSGTPKKLNFVVQKILLGCVVRCNPFDFFFLNLKSWNMFQNRSLHYFTIAFPNLVEVFMKIWYYVLFSTICYIGPIFSSYGYRNIGPYCQFLFMDSIKRWHKNAGTLSKRFLDILLLYIMLGNIRNNPCIG